MFRAGIQYYVIKFEIFRKNLQHKVHAIALKKDFNKNLKKRENQQNKTNFLKHIPIFF